MKLPWLLDGSVRNLFSSSFYCSILIRWIMSIASAKIPERGGSISPSSFWRVIARPLITSVSPIYLVDEFHFLFLLFLPLRPTQQRAWWHNLVCLGYWQMIKQMVVGFYWNMMLGCWVWILRALAQFKWSERFPG